MHTLYMMMPNANSLASRYLAGFKFGMLHRNFVLLYGFCEEIRLEARDDHLWHLGGEVKQKNHNKPDNYQVSLDPRPHTKSTRCLPTISKEI